MSAIKFILRFGKKRNKEKDFPIYLRYNHGEEKCLIATGRKCSVKEWNSRQGKPNNDIELEDRLNELRSEFNRNAVSKVIGEPEAAKVKEAWEKHKEEKKERLPEAVFKNTMLARWDDYLDFQDQTLFKGRKRTKGTIRNNRNSRELFSKYLASKRRTSIKPESFTIVDFQKYEHWLVNSFDAWVIPPKEKVKKIKSPNGIAKALKHLKSFLKWHIKNGGHIGFNINDIEYSETAGVKISLTEKEVAMIAQSEFKGRLNLVRDLIVLQCSTGVRISDLQRLCNNLNEEKTEFRIKTKKRSKSVSVPVMPLAKQALKRHNYRLPLIPEPKYREGIKEIYKSLWPSKTIEIGEGDNLMQVFIHEQISSHDMVRTFINIAWKKGMSVPTIAMLTGKSIQVLLKNYLIEDQEFASKEMLEKFDLSPLRPVK